jgi:hypothetical protein
MKLPHIVVSFKPSNTLRHTLDIGNSDAFFLASAVIRPELRAATNS